MKWDALITLFSSVGCESTKQRKHNELKMPRWDRLKHLPITETSGSDFLNLLTTGGTQTKQYLGCIHKLALEMGIISHPILPRKMWPKCLRKSKRGITNAEHQRLLLNLRLKRVFNKILPRRNYYTKHSVRAFSTNFEYVVGSRSVEKHTPANWRCPLGHQKRRTLLSELEAVNFTKFSINSIHEFVLKFRVQNGIEPFSGSSQ